MYHYILWKFNLKASNTYIIHFNGLKTAVLMYTTFFWKYYYISFIVILFIVQWMKNCGTTLKILIVVGILL